MNLHEYQAKQVLRKFGLPILAGHLCYTPGEAEAAADQLGGGICVVKAQVHAGGRGKAGGVKLAKSSAEARKHFSQVVAGLYKAFIESDLAMLEVNPLVLTKENTFVVLDAKVALEDNAAFRQKAIHDMMDYDEQDSRDLRAQKYGLSYIGLDGNIGCLVNGAGLAMATMDIIKAFGGEPANFLDVGGGATKENVTEAFRILLSDSKVKGILVNIFGGIMKCDVIATGIIEAAKEVGLKVPLVVRLQGTNVDLGRKMLAESGLAITPADTMDDAARKIVSLAK